MVSPCLSLAIPNIAFCSGGHADQEVGAREGQRTGLSWVLLPMAFIRQGSFTPVAVFLFNQQLHACPASVRALRIHRIPVQLRRAPRRLYCRINF